MRMFILLAALFIQVSQASEIIVMDTAEFNFIEHQKGRLEYAKRIAPLLAELRIPSDVVNVGDSDQVFEALAFDYKWEKISADVTKACKQRRNKKTCEALAKTRIDIFDFIKANPESAAE